ncbi:MAG: hypothetical protein FJX59_19995 [Alphaproteobacteria bacterium]|nr:hypothetical protein [Alphaproteobacteria bacterium]
MTEYHQQEYLLHTFRTATSVDRFHAIVTKACKHRHWVEIEAFDRSHVPFARVLQVTFSSLEDRTRVRIAMRFVDSDHEAARSPSVPKLARA